MPHFSAIPCQKLAAGAGQLPGDRRADQIDQTGRLKSSPQMQRPVALQALRIQFGQMSAGHVERGKGAIAQHDIFFKGAMDQHQRHRQGLALKIQLSGDPCTFNPQPAGRGGAIAGAEQERPDQPGADGVVGTALFGPFHTEYCIVPLAAGLDQSQFSGFIVIFYLHGNHFV